MNEGFKGLFRVDFTDSHDRRVRPDWLVPVEPDALQITTVDIGGTVGAIKLHSEDAGRTWTSIRPDDWPESDPV